MNVKNTLLITLLLIPILLFCELTSNIDFTIGGEYTTLFDLDTSINPENILDLPSWEASFPIENRINLYWDNIISLNFDYKLSTGKIDSNITSLDESFRFAQYSEYQLLKLNEFYISTSLGTSFLNINMGKMMPEFGVGYIRNSQSYFERITGNSGKWMLNTQLIKDSFLLELFYAPINNFIPDDYSDKDTLERAGDIIGLSSNSYVGDFYLEVVAFYDEDFFIGLSSSSEVLLGLLLYTDINFTNKHWIDRITGDSTNFTLKKFDNEYFDILFGISYTPLIIDWTFYLEGRYNQDGLTTDELSLMSDKLELINNLNSSYPGSGLPYYGDLASKLPFNSLSLLTLSLHCESFDYIFDLIKIKNTTFISLPIGVLNQLTFEIPLLDTINVNFSWNHIIDTGEYQYFLYRDSLSFSIKYNLYK